MTIYYKISDVPEDSSNAYIYRFWSSSTTSPFSSIFRFHSQWLSLPLGLKSIVATCGNWIVSSNYIRFTIFHMEEGIISIWSDGYPRICWYNNKCPGLFRSIWSILRPPGTTWYHKPNEVTFTGSSCFTAAGMEPRCGLAKWWCDFHHSGICCHPFFSSPSLTWSRSENIWLLRHPVLIIQWSMEQWWGNG